jgi:hypothetical protein
MSKSAGVRAAVVTAGWPIWFWKPGSPQPGRGIRRSRVPARQPARSVGSALIRVGAFFLALAAARTAAAVREYRYVECERYVATEGSGLRQEGFTPWMAHPSNAAVMVLNGPGGWLEYEIKGLGAGPYHLFVRGLAWEKGCEVEAYWDGAKIGVTSYARPATALRWSTEVGQVSGPGDHRLRLVGAPGITQAPYLDVILLTTQDGLQPDDGDQDFQSFSAGLPPLRLGTGPNARAILPAGEGAPAADSTLTVAAVALDSLGFGTNQATVRLLSTEAIAVQVRIGLAGAMPAVAEARLAGQGAETVVKVPWQAGKPGPARLELSITTGTQTLAGGAYPVVVPAPVTVALDAYAYPTGTASATWTPALAAGPEVAAALGVDIECRAADGDLAVLSRLRLGPGTATSPQTLPLAGLGRGRYEVCSSFTLAGQAVLTDRREFRVFDPLPAETWEAVRTTATSGPLLLLNGKPFLGRLLFHASPNSTTRGQGFNLVQCFGGDPNPLDSIQTHLDQCAQNGLWGMVALFNNRFFLPGNALDREHLREAVLRFKDHPALFGWDLIDEPDGHEGMTPAELAGCARLVRELDPNHIVWVNLCQWPRALEWLESQDLWSYDAYPFPVQGFAGYEPWLKLSDASLRGKRPLGTCLQTYQWSSHASLPMPTPDQLRASAWLHVLHGFNFFGYYSYNDPEPAGCLARDPLLWSYCQALNTELRALAALILSPDAWTTVAVEGGDGAVQAGVKDAAGTRYLVVVSGARETRHVRVRLPAAGDQPEILLDRPRLLSVTDGMLADDLRPYGTLICRLKPNP